MDFAILLCAALYIVHLTESVEAEKKCKVPNGDAGNCVSINICPPLKSLYKKKHKTVNENRFIRQSICGSRDSDPIKICCPPQSSWVEFVPTPVVVPPSPVYRRPKPEPTLLQPNTLMIPSFNSTDRQTDKPMRPKPDLQDYSSVCGIDSSSGNRITNGNETAVDQYPWLALLEYSNGFLGCGGSLISSRYVLTAAHCLKSLQNGEPLYVRLGEYNITSFPTDIVEIDGGGFEVVTVTVIAIRAMYTHPLYHRDLRLHDIGLIEMEEAANFSDFIKVICLPQMDYMPIFNSSTIFYVAGWGSDNFSSGTEVKMETSVPYKLHSQCPLVMEPYPIHQICAGGEGGRDTCSGDSGGPLMYETPSHRYEAVGIVSYGSRDCGKEGEPAVYTYVYNYLPWIRNILSGNVDQ
ncbi:phenoloxidase-activating enzyme-like [Danaus plexippus]|uniref:phenoloxidase-activating enzyme-like n=1 Tax=Danaus plexippus TaxID=13037 RepID=UPI002AAF89A0|nr:phenoloxidase-activating enzyme-like [Danaus plexippus]